MTNWGVLWRTYLLVHPLLAIWIALINLPSWPASDAAWREAGLTQQYYLGYFFYVSLVPLVLVHVAITWVYAQRPYRFPQALRVGLLVGIFMPALEVVGVLLSPLGLGKNLTTEVIRTLHDSKFWVGIVFFLLLGQLLALPHWLFFRRRPHQLLLHQTSSASPTPAS
jgi:hypothetical protein